MTPPPSALRLGLRLLLLAGLLPLPLSASSGEGVSAGPPFGVPEGREVETRLNAWESRTYTVENLLKRKLCPALKEHGSAAARLFEDGARVVLPANEEKPLTVHLLGLTGSTLAPREERSLEAAAIGAALEGWLAPHAVRDRCSVGFHTSVIFRGEPFLAQGRFHLIFGSTDATGGPIMDTMEGSFELRGPRKALRFSRFSLEQVIRVRAKKRRFVEVTRAAGLPSTFSERAGDLTLDGPDRGSLALFDVNGDGWLDIHTGRAGQNLLFVSQGDGTYAEKGKAYGLNDAGSARAVSFVDLDGDGDEDAVITNAIQVGRPGGITILERKGERFERVFRFRHDVVDAYRSIAVGDIDGDGDLDLHICNYGRPDLQQEIPSLLDDPSGESDVLLINLGKESGGKRWLFEDRAKEWGVTDKGWTLASALVDLDDDGWLDLVVADDFGSKRIYRNTGEGRFEDVSMTAGPGRERASGMGVDVADLNGDGHLDLYFSNMHSNAGTRLANFLPEGKPFSGRIGRAAAGNTLWLGKGELHFEEVGVAWGVADGGWAWGVRFLDIDLSGGTELSSPCGFITGPELEDG